MIYVNKSILVPSSPFMMTDFDVVAYLENREQMEASSVRPLRKREFNSAGSIAMLHKEAFIRIRARVSVSVAEFSTSYMGGIYPVRNDYFARQIKKASGSLREPLGEVREMGTDMDGIFREMPYQDMKETRAST